eukprot:scaffold393530_cov33-Attheya_sp.AAC.1
MTSYIGKFGIENGKYNKMWSNNLVAESKNRAKFAKARNELKKCKQSAIGKWMEKIANECNERAIQCNPKKAWEVRAYKRYRNNYKVATENLR